MADDRGEPTAGQGEAARLEAALNRIERAASHCPPRQEPGVPGGNRPELAHIAARLDGLIAELRALLAPPP